MRRCTMDYPKLKPCPFCGGKPYLEQRHRAFIKAETTRVAFVRCTECEARSNRFQLKDFGNTAVSREANLKAIEAWNRRADDGK
jgi:Lar family restriction alleviation protein